MDGVGQGVVSFEGRCSGTSDFTFNGTAVGDYEITFRIWHHVQDVNGRDASESVVIAVHDPETCECECDCDCAGECQCCQ